MSDQFWAGMAIILMSGVFNGSFALPMKYSRRWQWENTWLVFSFVSLLLIPGALAGGLVPNLWEVYRDVRTPALVFPLVFGFLWGIAQVTFGLGIKMVGVALTFAVVSGLGSLTGSLVPLLVFNPEDLFRPRGLLLLLSIPILIAGLVLYGIAGRRRENEQSALTAGTGLVQGSFAAGLAICIFTGIFGSSFNLGFAFGGDVIRSSVQHGAGALTATYAIWAVVLGAGFIPSFVYCGYLLVRNRSAALFLSAGSGRDALLGMAMGVIWATGIITYGIGATLVGRYGTSLGFMLFIAISILSANIFGLMTGEWRGTSSRTRKLLHGAVGVIMVAVVVLNLGGLF